MRSPPAILAHTLGGLDESKSIVCARRLQLLAHTFGDPTNSLPLRLPCRFKVITTSTRWLILVLWFAFVLNKMGHSDFGAKILGGFGYTSLIVGWSLQQVRQLNSIMRSVQISDNLGHVLTLTTTPSRFLAT